MIIHISQVIKPPFVMSEEMNTEVMSDFTALTEKLVDVLMEKEWQPLSVVMASMMIDKMVRALVTDSPDIISPEKLKEFKKLAEPLVGAVVNIAMAGLKKEN